MKASELRLGNWVEQPNDGVTRVTAVLNDLQIKTETGYVDKYCSPIPLTEEWLLKFGFDKHKTTDIYPTFAKQMFNWNDSVLYIIGYGFINHIKHVHQLQNLYFALTGEELELT